MRRWKIILAAAVLALAAAGCAPEEEEEKEPVKKVADLVIDVEGQDEEKKEEPDGRLTS